MALRICSELWLWKQNVTSFQNLITFYITKIILHEFFKDLLFKYNACEYITRHGVATNCCALEPIALTMKSASSWPSAGLLTALWRISGTVPQCYLAPVLTCLPCPFPPVLQNKSHFIGIIFNLTNHFFLKNCLNSLNSECEKMAYCMRWCSSLDSLTEQMSSQGITF